MVVENLKQIRVSSYRELYEMYLKSELGVSSQRMPNNIMRVNEGDDLILIKSLLSEDKQHFYHVQYVDKGFTTYFIITIIGFNITKKINKVISYSLNAGNDGIWEDFCSFVTNGEWEDAKDLGKLTLKGEETSLKHVTSSTII